MMLPRKLFLSICFILTMAAAPVLAEDAEDIDPIEGFNRAVFTLNQGVDSFLIRPIAWGYKHAMPNYGQERISSFFLNLGEPVNFLNAGLQGDMDQAFYTFWRFVINSTVGIVGFYDQAQYAGLPYRKEDFGQTLGNWGLDHGFYLVLPIIGPSSARDGVGRIVDIFSDPFNYINDDAVVAGLTVGKIIDARAGLLEITDQFDQSIDPYAAYRSAYLQRRLDLLNNGKEVQPEPVLVARPVQTKKKKK